MLPSEFVFKMILKPRSEAGNVTHILAGCASFPPRCRIFINVLEKNWNFSRKSRKPWLVKWTKEM